MLNWTMKRLFAFIIAFLLGFGLFVPAAFAYTYTGKNAADYAHKWSSNTETLRNPNYKYWKQDCANFVSQSLRAGGMPNDYSGGWVWGYSRHWYGDTNTASWSAALNLVQYLDGSNRGWIESYAHNMKARYTSAYYGDVYAYEWGDDDGKMDHVAVASGWGTFANYYDSAKDKNYRSVTEGYGDYMSQHTTDRDYAPWNWGYWSQRNLTTRAKMNTWLVHING
jgi:hypothetical protein